jgi:hypothetical protein
LVVRIEGEPPDFRAKPRFCKKDTVKRRKEKERVLVMMRFANLRENRDSGKRLGSRIVFRLKFPEYYPPCGVDTDRIQIVDVVHCCCFPLQYRIPNLSLGIFPEIPGSYLSFHIYSRSVSRLRHPTGPFPVSPVPALAGEVIHRYRL